MKVHKHRVKIDWDDIFLSTLLVCCAWGKIHWGWFWVVFLLVVSSSGYWGKDRE